MPESETTEWKPADFEPYTGQDYAKGWYKVRLPDGTERWAWPNAGKMNLMESVAHGSNDEAGPDGHRWDKQPWPDMMVWPAYPEIFADWQQYVQEDPAHAPAVPSARCCLVCGIWERIEDDQETAEKHTTQCAS